jgi:CspA family cold shock protein
MNSGVVKFWHAEKGYGFLSTADGDHFVHVSTVKRAGFASLAEGQPVRFEVGIDVKNGRTCAVEIELVQPVTSPKLGDEEDPDAAFMRAFARRSSP